MSSQVAATVDARPGIQLPTASAQLPLWRPDPRRLRPVWADARGLSWQVLLDPVTFWTVLGTYEGDPIRFERWQVADLRDHRRYRACEKAPQIGWSWTRALEALWEALLFRDVTWGFVSVSEREAKEKVLYARKAYEGLPTFVQRWVPLITESNEELGFGESSRVSRLMSFAATASLRGRRMSVTLDECDFYRDGGKEAFRIGMGRATRGGRVNMGSTCWSQDTMLDQVMQGAERKFSRARYPADVAEHPDVVEALENAMAELGADEVEEEYYCVRGGGGVTTFPSALIAGATRGAGLALDELPPGGRYVAGYDVGASRHPAVLTILQQTHDGWEQALIDEARDDHGAAMTLPAQQKMLEELLGRFPALVLVPDVNGIGMQIGQALREQFGARRVLWMQPGSRPPDLPSQDKGLMITECKRALEAGELWLCQDRDQALQFRRTRLVGGKVEQPGSHKRTHYDRLWAAVYAWYGVAATQGRHSFYADRELIVIGGDRVKAGGRR